MIDATHPFPKANGLINFELSNVPWMWRWVLDNITIYGGPYVRGYVPGPNNYGVCLVERIPEDQEHALHMPIRDFGIPTQSDAEVRRAVLKTLMAAAAGKNVYVGCLGGWGRTGLFLCLLMKTLGVQDPVPYVRKHYTASAVETEEQEMYVARFEPPLAPVMAMVMHAFAEKTWFGNHLRRWGWL